MKKLLHKSCQWLVLLIAMLAVNVSASAETVRISCESQSPIGKTFGAVQVSGSGWTAQYISQYGILCMSSGTISFTSEKEITKISFDNGNNYAAEYSRGTFETSDATLESVSNDKIAYTVSGKTSVTFSAGMYTNIRIIEVELADSGETPDPGTGGGTVTPDPGTGGGTVTPDPGTGTGTGTGTGAGSALTFDFSASGNGTLTQSPVTVTYSRSSEAGKSIASLSMFDNPLVFTSTGANIVKIEFTGKNLNLVNASLDGYNNPVWEGNAKSVSFTVNGGWSDFAAIYTAVVTLEGTAPDPGTDPEPGTDPDPDPEVTKPSFPAENVAYQLQLVDNYATSYLNLQKDKTQAAILGAAPQGFTFTWDDENKGFIVKNTDGLYLGKPDAIVNSGIGCQNPDYWTVEKNDNSYYLKCSKGYLGFGSYNHGAVATSNNASAEDSFIFTEYVAPDLTPFASIPASFIRESSIDMQVGDQIVSQLAFVFTASSDYGVDAFKLYPNGKSISLIVDGKSTSATLTCTQSGYCSISGMYPVISDEGDHNIVFPEGTFEAANGKVNAAFEYVYTILPAEAVQYTVGIYGPWSQNGAQPAPAGAYIVYKNAPETHYASGDSYASENVPRATDFACGIPYWEIDEQHSIVSEYGKSITIYLKRIPYTYDIVIEGCEQGAVTYYGTQYSATDDITTLEFIDEDEIEAVAVKGYNIVTTTINQPAEGKGGVIYVKYEEKPVVYATVDRTDPATGVYDLNDHLNGLSSLNVYLAKGDEFSQFGYYTSDGNMPEGINVTDAQGNVTNYTVGGIMSWNGYSFCIVNLANAIREAGIYTINIPAGALPLADEEKVSPEMHLTYEVKAATVFEIDNRDGVTAQGNRKDNGGLKTLTGFEITAPEGVTFDAIASDAKLYMQGEMDPETWTYGDPVEIEGVTFSFGTTKQTVLVNFSEPYAPEASESYTFILPAGTIVATDGRTNKEISLSAYVDPVEYFDLVVTYPVEGNAVAPVDHITVQLPEGLTVTNVDGYILFNGYQAEGYTYTQNDRELTINFGSEHAGEAGSTVSYYFGGSNITATDANSTVWKNNWKDANNIPVTAAPVEYLIEFAGWEITTHGPQVTYNGQSYTDQQHITAVDLTVEQLTATATEGYDYVITIDQPGYEASHNFGRILVTYTGKEYAAVSRVSPAEGEISLDNAEGLGSITIFMDGEAGWDEDVYCGGGNPVPAGVSMVGPNGAIELPWEGGAYGFCMWAGSNQINVNFGGTLKTPGQYTLIIPAGLNTIGGKENPRMEYTWTVKEATTFEFDRWTVEAIGDRNNDGVQLSLTGFTVALPENLSDCSTEVPGPVALYITVSTGDEMSEEPAEPTLVNSTYSITDGVVTFTFPEAYTEKGRVSVTLNAKIIGINGLSNKAFSTSFYVDPNPTQYISLETATPEEMGTAFNEITEYSVTSSSNLWAGIVLDITAEMLADKTITVSYYTQEEGSVEKAATVASVSEANGVVTFQFTEPVTIPFDAWYSVIFPEGFITFEADNIQSYSARFNNHKLVESYVYDVIYDETVPAGARLLQNGNDIPPATEGSSYGGIEPAKAEDFTATAVLGMKPVVTVVQPTREAPVGTITLSYKDNRIFMAPEDVIDFEGTENEAGDYTSVSKIYINAPEGRTYETVDLSQFYYYVGQDLVAYPKEGISYELSAEKDVVTINLEPAYSTVGTFSWVILDGGLVLDGGTVYAGANYGIAIVPPYDYATVSRVSPAESTIALEDEYAGLRYINIYFKEKIAEDFTAFSAAELPDGFSLTDPDGQEITLSYLTGWADSDNIGITTNLLQRTLGDYTLHIPEGVFTFEGGKKNPVLDYTWTVTAPSTFAIGYYDVAADGQVKSDGQLKNLYGFTLTAPEGVTFASVAADAKVIIPGEMDYETGTRTEDEEVEGATITLREDGTIYVGFEPAYAPAEYTSYSFVIPAGAITAEDGRTSKEIRLSAGVDPVSYFDLATATEKETTSKANTFSTYTITSDDNAWANLTGLLTADSFKGEVEVEYWANGEKNLQSQPVAGFTANADKSLTLKFAKDFTVPFDQYYSVFLPEGFITFPDLALSSKKASFYDHKIFEKSNLEGVELSTYVATDTQEGITAACPSFGDPRGANIFDSANGAEGAWPWGIIKVNSDKTIRKVELTVNESASSVMEKDTQGEFSVSGNVATWTGSSHALVFSASEDIYVSKLVVYYDADEVIVTENTVALAESDINGGQVGYVNKYINLTFAENFSVTHNTADYPEGVKFVRVDTPSEEPVAITNFAYFAGSPTLTVTLAESVTAGGTYKLVIPEGILPFGNLKSNVETIVTWTISPNDINGDGKEDNVDDAIAISDIILQNSNAERYDTSKADVNGDGEVTIGDLVKYIQHLQSKKEEGAED